MSQRAPGCSRRCQARTKSAIALELSGRRLEQWQLAARDLARKRSALVDSLEARNQEAAAALIAAYHAHLISMIESLPRTNELKINDPELAEFLSAFVVACASDTHP